MANAGNVGEPSWVVGRSNRRLVPWQDALGAEGGFIGSQVSKALFKTGASSKLYQTQAGSKPACNFVSPALGGWRTYSHTPAETRLVLHQAAIGVNPYFAVYVAAKDQPGTRAAKDVYRFLEENVEYYRETRSAANVALLYSSRTVDWYAGVDIPWADRAGLQAAKAEAVGSFNQAFYGFYEILVRSRIPFDVIDEETVAAGELGRYDLAILPNCACLDGAVCRAISDWVRVGGTIIADFETAHYDEFGGRRRTTGLAEVFGVESLNELAGPRRCDFALVGPNPPEYLGRLDAAIMPAPRHNLRVRLAGGTAPIVFCRPLVSNIPEAIEPSDEPFLVENAFGRGRSYFLPAQFGEWYAQCQLPAYRRLVEGIIRHRVRPPVTVAGPAHTLEVLVRDQPAAARRLVHLVNYEIGPLEEVIPAENVTVALPMGAPPRRVRALHAGRDLAASYADGVATVLLPRMAEHELVVFEG